MRTVVAAPQAAPPLHSLVRSARTSLDAETDWQRGLAYLPEVAGGYRALSGCSAETVDHTRAGAPVADYMPWELQVEDPCRTTFGYNREDTSARLARVLESVESFAIARELWTGELTRQDEAAGGDSRNLYLAKDATVLGSGAVAPKRGLGLLEQAVGEALYGQQAFLHVPRVARPFFPELVKVGNLLYTNIDNVVVSDAGYPNLGPAGGDGVPTTPTVNTAWVYATGPVVVRRSTVFGDGPENETVDPSTNTITRRASKVVAGHFDPTALFAVQITLS